MILSYKGEQINYNLYFITIINQRKSQEIISVTIRCYGNEPYGNDVPNMKASIALPEAIPGIIIWQYGTGHKSLRTTNHKTLLMLYIESVFQRTEMTGNKGTPTSFHKNPIFGGVF